MAESTAQLQIWIDLANGGDAQAREALIAASCERLRVLVHRMLAGDRVRRWEETDDVLQQALVRLYRDLANLQPASVRDYLRLAAFQIRRVLVEMGRHYYGPRGLGAHHASNPSGETDASRAVWDTPDNSPSPSQLASRQEQRLTLHEAIDRLPDEEREVVELLFIHELTQAEAAELLGVDVRTVQRRWQRGRLALEESVRLARSSTRGLKSSSSSN